MDVAAGLAAFLDVPALAVVFGGGLAFAVAKGGLDQSRNQALLNFAEGAVYLGWLGFLAGCIGMSHRSKHSRSRCCYCVVNRILWVHREMDCDGSYWTR